MGNSAKRDAKKSNFAERRRNALEMRKGGSTLLQIATALGYSDPSNVRRDIIAAIKDIFAEPAADVLQLELGRLDAMLAALWQSALSGDYAAIDRVIRIMDRRAAYLGLDAPVKTEMSGSVETKGAHDAILAQLARIADCGADAGSPREGDSKPDDGTS